MLNPFNIERGGSTVAVLSVYTLAFLPDVWRLPHDEGCISKIVVAMIGQRL